MGRLYEWCSCHHAVVVYSCLHLVLAAAMPRSDLPACLLRSGARCCHLRLACLSSLAPSAWPCPHPNPNRIAGSAKGAPGGGAPRPGKGHHADLAQKGSLTISPSMEHMSLGGGGGARDGGLASAASQSDASLASLSLAGDAEAGGPAGVGAALAAAAQPGRSSPVLPR